MGEDDVRKEIQELREQMESLSAAFKGKRRRGVRAFRRALLRGGVGREAADRLAAEYAAIGRLRTYLMPRKVRLPFRPRPLG